MGFISRERLQVCGVSFDLNLKTCLDSKQTSRCSVDTQMWKYQIGTTAYISNG